MCGSPPPCASRSLRESWHRASPCRASRPWSRSMASRGRPRRRRSECWKPKAFCAGYPVSATTSAASKSDDHYGPAPAVGQQEHTAINRRTLRPLAAVNASSQPAWNRPNLPMRVTLILTHGLSLRGQRDFMLKRHEGHSSIKSSPSILRCLRISGDLPICLQSKDDEPIGICYQPLPCSLKKMLPRFRITTDCATSKLADSIIPS